MEAIFWNGVIILLALIVSAFLSATETALTSLSSLKAKHLREEKGKSAKVLDLWLESPQRVLAAILIGNNLVNIFAAIWADQFVATLFGNRSPFLVTAVMTAIIVLFAEILPKTAAKSNATSLAVPLLSLFRIFYWILLPFTFVSSQIIDAFSRLLSRGGVEADPQITEEELEFLINVGEEEGVLEEQKHEMLSGVFELGDTVVREIMVHRIDMTALPTTASVEEAILSCEKTGLSRIPLYEERIDNIVGVVFAKDLLFHIREHRDDRNAWDRPVDEFRRETMFVPESKPVDQLFQDFRKQRQHMAIVLDEYGGTSGLVTMEDIFEEIVGEVRDEYDNEEDAIRPTQVPSQYLVECKIHIDDFCDFFDLNVVEMCHGHQAHEFDTLGGLVLFHFGQIPKIGDRLTINKISLEVVEVSRRRVRRVLVRKLESDMDVERQDTQGSAAGQSRTEEDSSTATT